MQHAMGHMHARDRKNSDHAGYSMVFMLAWADERLMDMQDLCTPYQSDHTSDPLAEF